MKFHFSKNLGPRHHRHHHDEQQSQAGQPDERHEHGSGHPNFGRRGANPGGFGPGGFGPGGFGPGGFGPGGFGARGFGGRGFGGKRAKPGEVREAILSVLEDEPTSGYGLIKSIALRSGGAWRVSPGSIYPTLSALEAEDLINSEGTGKRSTFSLTASGKEYVEQHRSELEELWERNSSDEDGSGEVRQSVHKLMGAVRQVMMEGEDVSVEKTKDILDRARKEIYKLLAE